MRGLFDELNQEEMFPGLPEVKMWNPVVEMAELDEELRLTAELPGMTRDDVEIAVEHNIPTLRGEKVEKKEKEKEEKKMRYHVWERGLRKIPALLHATQLRSVSCCGLETVNQ